MTNGKKTTKRALISSALSLLLCFTMLIGTTFAWFTDNASTTVNKIQAGTLDVALEMKVGDEWVNAEGETLNFVAKDDREEILWEPGCTYETAALRIKNVGNLALKYKVVVSGIDGDAELNKAIDWYYSINMASTGLGGTGSTTPTDLYELEKLEAENYLYPEGITGNGRTDESVFKIVAKMDKDAGNEYQGKSIEGIAVTVVATQYTYENDSYDNQYDKDATFVTPVTAAELKEILTNKDAEGKVTLDKDYVVTDSWTTIKFKNESVTIDGKGHTIFNLDKPLFNFYGGTFKVENLTIKNSNVTANVSELGAGVLAEQAQWANLYVENCHVQNCTVESAGDARTAALVGYVAGGAEIKNCSVKNCEVIANGSVGAIIGHDARQTGYKEDTMLENCTVTETTLKATDEDWRVGTMIGTVGGYDTTIKNCTSINNTLEMNNSEGTGSITNPNHELYGRTANGATVTISE